MYMYLYMMYDNYNVDRVIESFSREFCTLGSSFYNNC